MALNNKNQGKLLKVLDVFIKMSCSAILDEIYQLYYSHIHIYKYMKSLIIIASRFFYIECSIY